MPRPVSGAPYKVWSTANALTSPGCPPDYGPKACRLDIRRRRERLRDVAVRARPALNRILERRRDRLNSTGKLLETLSYQATLKRGYALVSDATGQLVRSPDQAPDSQDLIIRFDTGDLSATSNGPLSSPTSPAKARPQRTKPAANPKPATRTKTDNDDQGSLF